MATFKPGDKAYYLVLGGWGSGQLFKVHAIVEHVTAKMATVALLDLSTKQFERKRVALKNLQPRTEVADIDKRYAASGAE